MSSEDAMQFMPLAAMRNHFSCMPAKFGAAIISSAVMGLLLGHALFSRQQVRIPLDEWQPFVGQEHTTANAEPNELEPAVQDVSPAATVPHERASSAVQQVSEVLHIPVRPEVSHAAIAPREQASSAVQLFSEVLHIPAAEISLKENQPQRGSKDVAPSRPPRPIVHREPRRVRTPPDRPPQISTSQATESAGAKAAKDQDAGLIQRSYRAIASAPSKLWSTTQDAAKSVGSFGEAAWDRIKP